MGRPIAGSLKRWRLRYFLLQISDLGGHPHPPSGQRGAYRVALPGTPIDVYSVSPIPIAIRNRIRNQRFTRPIYANLIRYSRQNVFDVIYQYHARTKMQRLHPHPPRGNRPPLGQRRRRRHHCSRLWAYTDLGLATPLQARQAAACTTNQAGDDPPSRSPAYLRGTN
jgi:hypothetical protein